MRCLCLFVALLLTASAQSSATVVPLEKFADSPQLSRLALSPDGRYAASLQDINGEQWLVVLDLDEKKKFRINPGNTVTGLRRTVASFRWISDHRISFKTTVWDGFYFTGVSAVDCDGRNWKAFSGPDVDPRDRRPLAATDIIYTFGDADQAVLMLDRGSNEGADLIYPDVIRVNTLTGSVKTVEKNPGNVVAWVPDRTGAIRLGITRDGARTGVLYRDEPGGAWRKLPLIAPERGRVQPLGFDYSGKRLLVVADNETKRRAVYYYDLVEGKIGEVVASHPEFDIIPDQGSPAVDGVPLAGPVLSDLTESVIGIRYVTDGPKMRWFEPAFAELQKMVDRMLPNTVNLIISRSKDEKRFLMLSFSDTDPGTFILLDFKGEKPRFDKIGTRMPDIPVKQMVPMFPVKYAARDGTSINGYLTLPPGEKQKGLPFVVMPHGGPFVRDSWQFNPLVQFLANRGYAVLQMNFRGSPGYGTEFHRKGRREIGRGMQDDIEDGTRWAVAQGFADPQRIAIVGGSYGGFAALFALAHNPELYRCGISIAGVTDWEGIIRERTGEEYKFAYQHFKEWIGDPKLELDFLKQISPVNFADKIKAPLFIVQGKDDRTVPPKQARRMVDALEKVGRPPKTLYFSDEAHGVRKERNRVKLYTEIEGFLAKNLAPVGNVGTSTAKPGGEGAIAVR